MGEGKMKLPEPNWQKLSEIRQSMEYSRASGTLLYDDWKAYADQALEAAGGCADLIGFIGRYTQRGWIDRLRRDDSERAPAA